jgi:hypothetical protein
MEINNVSYESDVEVEADNQEDAEIYRYDKYFWFVINILIQHYYINVDKQMSCNYKIQIRPAVHDFAYPKEMTSGFLFEITRG